jgi:hypothetical protein
MSHGRFALTGTPEDLSEHEDFDAAYFGVSMNETSPTDVADRP